MRETNSLVAEYSRLSFLLMRVQAFFARRPEWRAWLISLCVWALLAMPTFLAPSLKRDPHALIFCSPTGTVRVAGHSAYEVQSASNEEILYTMVTIISTGSGSWILMVMAMMFPLLNEPIRHVAFSVRRKSRSLGIACFLAGYTISWASVGIAFLLLPFFMERVMGERTAFADVLIQASVFLAAAVLAWQPGRALKMVKCGQTMPVCIHGRQLLTDSLHYGVKMGFACVNMCWVPMAALVLAHHDLMLMCAVTVVAIYERYLLPHTSRWPGYAWAAIAFFLLGTELPACFF